MNKQTPLFAAHKDLNANMIDFAGWNMPLHYGSQITEHLAVRQDAGCFDVSHMRPIDIIGDKAFEFLQNLLANDIKKAVPGKALYSCMLNTKGGVIDDLIVYCISPSHFTMVVNAATTSKDLDWINAQADGMQLAINAREDLAIIAVQGPQAREKVKQAFSKQQNADSESLKRFCFTKSGDWLIARTGYTGEDGYEVILPNSQALSFWQALIEFNITPIGLGARDSLRLEAGLNLYGQDMDENINPYAANLGWTVDLKDPDRDFIGKSALLKLKDSTPEKLFAIVLVDKGICRSKMKVVNNEGQDGILTSGGFSPVLQRSIAFARMPKNSIGECRVQIRQTSALAKIISPPFIKQGKANFEL